jgi:outer membrane protein assembly factor BamD (BamD/ComL family)
MNLFPKTFLFATLLGLCPLAQAEYVYTDSHWQVKPGTTSDIKAENRLSVVLTLMDQASRLGENGDTKAAINAWENLGNNEKNTQVEAVALLERARLYVKRAQFDNAVDLLDEIYNRHSNFPNFNQVVELQFDIANRFANGERRMLGGWFVWFKDTAHAITLWDKTVRLAPNSLLAEEALIRKARLATELDRLGDANEALERIVSDYTKSQYLPEALERLADLRSKESMGANWDQTSTLEAADHWRTLAAQFPKDPRSKAAADKIAELRDRAARAKLVLAQFYWYKRNNPEAAKLMANASRSISPESASAKEAETLLDEIQKNPNPPKTFADTLLGVYPRPKLVGDNKPVPINDDLDSLGFKKEPIKPATDAERR